MNETPIFDLKVRYTCAGCKRFVSRKALIFRDDAYFHLSHPRCQQAKGEPVPVLVHPVMEKVQVERRSRLRPNLDRMMYDRSPGAVERIMDHVRERAAMIARLP